MNKNLVIALCIILAVIVTALAVFLIIRERNGLGGTSGPSTDKGSSSQGGSSGSGSSSTRPEIGDNEVNIGDLFG